MKNQRISQGLVLILLSVFLSAVTMVLGAVPMHALYLKFSRKTFLFSLGLVVVATASFGFLPLAGTVATLALLVYVFNEFERKGFSLLVSGVAAVSVSAMSLYAGIQVWLQKSGSEFEQVVRPPIEQFVAQLKTVNNGKSQLVVEDLLAQIPSGAVVLLIVGLALALFFESRMSQLFRMEAMSRRLESFLTYRLPDFLLWTLLGALVATFYQGSWPEEVRVVGSNVLNVLVVLYFFQGLAVVAVFFNAYKVSPFWRAIWYVFIVLQLFLFVSCVGFIDFWLDFRQRLQKKTAQTAKVKDKGGWT